MRLSSMRSYRNQYWSYQYACFWLHWQSGYSIKMLEPLHIRYGTFAESSDSLKREREMERGREKAFQSCMCIQIEIGASS